MKSALSGKTLRWKFDDGPLAGRTFEHTFGTDGTVSWRALDPPESKPAPKPSSAKQPGAKPEAEPPPPPKAKYQIAQLSFDVFVVTYQSDTHTLTTVLDFKTALLIAVASKPGEVTVQHGSFEAVLPQAA